MIMEVIMKKHLFKFISIGIVLIFVFSNLFSQSIGMPPKILAVLAQKVIAYVKDFPSKKVTIVHMAGQAKTAGKVVKEFVAVGFTADAVEEANAASVSGDIIILFPGLSDAALNSLPFKKKIILSTSKAHTDNGQASFAIVNVGGKPKIMVNLAHIDKAGIKVSGKLYRIAQKSK